MRMESPCIGNCTLNENDVCIGCGRLLNEITSWQSYSDRQRQLVLEQSVKRKQGLFQKTS